MESTSTDDDGAPHNQPPDDVVTPPADPAPHIPTGHDGMAQPVAPSSSPEFAPADPWDGREPFDWTTKWPPEALSKMRIECAYLVGLLAISAIAIFVLGTNKLAGPLRLTTQDAHLLALYGGAWIGGILGGCVFSIKWYYHSIARGKWHMDRRAWRFLTPLVSGALAFAVATLLISRILPILDPRITRSMGAIVGLSFLVGYFSDNAVAALAATADRVLGTKTSLRSRPGELDAQ